MQCTPFLIYHAINKDCPDLCSPIYLFNGYYDTYLSRQCFPISLIASTMAILSSMVLTFDNLFYKLLTLPENWQIQTEIPIECFLRYIRWPLPI
jgi:hypothetical protein